MSFLNNSLNGLSFAKDSDGNWGYKVGADPVVPFRSGNYFAADYFLITRSDWTLGSYVTIDTTNYSLLNLQTKNGTKTGISMTLTYPSGATKIYENSKIEDATYEISDVVSIIFRSVNTGGWRFFITLQ